MITKDRVLIESILSLPEIRSCDQSGQLVYIDQPNAVYLYSDGCLFPSVVFGEALSIHAAVPLAYRGKVASNAAKKVMAWAIKNLRLRVVIARVSATHRHVNMFAVMAGMKKYKSTKECNYYEVYADGLS
jgi:hypothetical protein